MKKKIIYLIIFLIGLLLTTNVYADYDVTECYYVGENSNGILRAQYNVITEQGIDDYAEDGVVTIWGNMVSTDETFFSNETEPIKNWTTVKQNNGFKGKDYFLAHKNDSITKGCPPYAVLLDGVGHLEFVVADENSKASFILLGKTKQGYELLSLIKHPELKDKTYTVKFNSNYDNGNPEISATQTFKYGSYAFLKSIEKLGFEYYGYKFIGWTVKYNNKWLCETDDGDTEYKSTCKNKAIYHDGVEVNIYWDNKDDPNPVIELYAQWLPKRSMSPLTVNQYNLGESTCKGLGYVWNKTSENSGYCNTDNLEYVSCGGAQDIPAQVPSLVSFIINLLKIATPIILIFVSVVDLIKALTASKEDEIKKAQQTLVKRLIAAVLVFFVVTIVQFVMLWVTDEDYDDSIESCLNCFLNDSCSTTYYKTNVGGKYYCTQIANGDSKECD